MTFPYLEFETILNCLDDAIIILNDKSQIVFFNKNSKDLFQPKKESLLGKHFADILPKNIVLSTETRLKKLFDGLTVKSFEYVAKNSEGIKHFYEIHFRLLESPSLAMLIIRDITDRKLLEMDFLQREKLSSLGQLASHVAHEIKNPLTGMRLGLDYLLNNYPFDDQQKQFFSHIKDDIQRMNQITDHLLNYSKVKEKRKQRIDINKLIDKSLFLIKNQAEKQGIEFRTEFSEILPQLLVDEDEIHQVLLNICLNAIQAIEGKGLVEIKTTNTMVNERLGVLITVQDTGKGIPASIMHKINDLFFTTKSEGTGLGLPMSQKIIREHGGSIVIESEVDHGSLVKIFLPVELGI